MWDKPQVLNQWTSGLLGLGCFLLAFAALHYVVHLPMFALQAVHLSSSPQRADVAALNKVVREQLRGNFFTVDLEQTRKAFEAVPWVRKVSVRRKFPWQLEVTLEEQVAVAHWNVNELVNGYGEVFAASTAQILPSYTGPADSSAQVKEMFAAYSQQLTPLQRQIEQINLSARFAWQLHLDNGMVLELGRSQMQERLARFVAVYPYSLALLPHGVNHVDLRYGNGFAAYLPEGLPTSKHTKLEKS
jgi:cell division protein FtsQ